GSPEVSANLKPEDIFNIINGVLLDPASGAARAYAVHKRDRYGMTLIFDRMVPAAFSRLHGYFDRYDQVRGISPVASAVNQFRDLYESFDYGLVKQKVAQLFAMVITRQSGDELGTVEPVQDVDADGNTLNDYEVDFGRGPLKLELDPGDDAKFLSSQNPSSETQEFWERIIMISLKSLDIPYSFFDESHTNYS